MLIAASESFQVVLESAGVSIDSPETLVGTAQLLSDRIRMFDRNSHGCASMPLL